MKSLKETSKDSLLKLYITFHYTGVPNNCQNLTIILQNEAFENQGSHQGIYQVSGFVNEKPMWTFTKNGKAIWYVQELNDWGMGNLEHVGTNTLNLFTSGNQGDVFPFDIASDKWKYLNDLVWADSAINDITIECSGMDKDNGIVFLGMP